MSFHHVHLPRKAYRHGPADAGLRVTPGKADQLQEEEFFASRAPDIADAPNQSERRRRIAALEAAPEGSPARRLFDGFVAAKHAAEAASVFAHTAIRFPLTGVGDVNTYALFAEAAKQLLGPSGRGGIIVPTGIATDDSTKAFFGELVSAALLVSLYDFEDRDAIFPGVHRSYRFSLLTIGPAPAAEFAFFATDVQQLGDEARRFTLKPEELVSLNPNTRTAATFRSQADAELTKKIYARVPVLWREEIRGAAGDVVQAEANPWGLRFLRMFDMSMDSALFRTQPAAGLLPLYEAKLIHQFDHRWATYASANAKAEPESRDVTDAEKSDPAFTVRPRYWVEEHEVLLRLARLPDLVLKALRKAAAPAQVLALRLWAAGHLRAHGDRKAAEVLLQQVAEAPAKDRAEMGLKSAPLPVLADSIATEAPWPPGALQAVLRWSKAVSAKELDGCVAAVLDEASPRWLAVFRGITRATDERSFISTAVPRAGFGNSAPLLLTGRNASPIACLLANLSALVMDYMARQKIGGINLNFFLVQQMAVVAPEAFAAVARAFIVPRALELTYTAHDLRPLYDDVVADDAAFDPRSGGDRGRPFPWDPSRRAQLRAELDAYFARLYGLTRDELRFVLDPRDVYGPDYPSETFRVLRDNEMHAFGEYRTRRLVLEAWDRLEAAR